MFNPIKRGLMTIYDQLHQDHEKAKKVIGELKKTSEGAEKTREHKFAQLKQELEVHTEFENEVFYPAVGKNSKAKQTVQHGMKEHEKAEAVLEELDDMDKTSPEWVETLSKLESMLQDHIQEEENEIFKLARDAIDDSRAQQMGKEYKERKQQELKKSA